MPKPNQGRGLIADRWYPVKLISSLFQPECACCVSERLLSSTKFRRRVMPLWSQAFPIACFRVSAHTHRVARRLFGQELFTQASRRRHVVSNVVHRRGRSGFPGFPLGEVLDRRPFQDGEDRLVDLDPCVPRRTNVNH